MSNFPSESASENLFTNSGFHSLKRPPALA
jgi:hypothetical protein